MTFLPTELAATLKGNHGKAGGCTVDVEQTHIAFALNAKEGTRHNAGVRRLTPTECERLQGLPDGWTLLDPKTPDSRRYSALGDAVTATVAEWIGRRLT